MKRTAKIVLSIAGVAFVIGLILHTIGLAMGGRRESAARWGNVVTSIPWLQVSSEGVHIGGSNGIHIDDDGISVGGEHGHHISTDGEHVWWGTSGEKYTDGGEVEPFTKLEVSVELGDIFLEKGDNYSLDLSWQGKDYGLYFEEKDGKLKIWSEGGGWYGKSYASAQITVTVPEGAELDDVELFTDLGDISLNADVTVREAELSTSMGDVNCQGVYTDQLEVESDMGDVSLHLPGAQSDYCWELCTDMGEVLVEGNGSNSGLGDICVVGGGGQSSVQASTSMGDIELYFQ